VQDSVLLRASSRSRTLEEVREDVLRAKMIFLMEESRKTELHS
jgi:hypothetical protein